MPSKDSAQSDSVVATASKFKPGIDVFFFGQRKFLRFMCTQYEKWPFARFRAWKQTSRFIVRIYIIFFFFIDGPF